MIIEYIHKHCCVFIIVDLIATFLSYTVSTTLCVSFTCCTVRVQLGKLFGGKSESLISWLFFWSIFLAKWDSVFIHSCFWSGFGGRGMPQKEFSTAELKTASTTDLWRTEKIKDGGFSLYEAVSLSNHFSIVSLFSLTHWMLTWVCSMALYTAVVAGPIS